MYESANQINLVIDRTLTPAPTPDKVGLPESIVVKKTCLPQWQAVKKKNKKIGNFRTGIHSVYSWAFTLFVG